MQIDLTNGSENIKQRSFADDLVEVHSALEELDDTHNLIDWSRDKFEAIQKVEGFLFYS